MNKINELKYVECINNKDNDTNIIEGKIYKVYEELTDVKKIIIKNNLGNFEYYSMDNFREVKPLYKVRCINNRGREKTLTLCGTYNVLYRGDTKTPLYLIEDDEGELKAYRSSRFNIIPLGIEDSEDKDINKKEGIKLMLEGKKITHIEWGQGYYLYIDEHGVIKSENDTETDLNFYSEGGWKEYIEDNRKEVPEQMEYLKDIWNMIFDKTGHSKAPCEDIENCNNCPLMEENTGNCYDYYIADILKNINKNWKLDK